jgi:uncharacterized damage-inducible protein DinB
MEDLRFPIGRFSKQETYSIEDVSKFINQISVLPSRLLENVSNLSNTQLETPYREGGWTVKQLIHHMADSHVNAYIRTKWTLTEDCPLIKAYDEKLWAITPETNNDIGLSLLLIKSLHQKWATLLSQLTEVERARSFIHPETQNKINLNMLIHNYAWHGEHHLAHILGLRRRMNW